MPLQRNAMSSIVVISFNETYLAPGCGLEVDAITCCQHADAVVNDGFRGVGAWRDRANNPKRGVFKQNHATITG